MPAFTRVGVLVERLSVKARQAVGVAWKMRGHPVNDDLQSGGMAGGDKIAEALR